MKRIPKPVIPCCCCCKRSASEIDEYIREAAAENEAYAWERDVLITPQQWVEREDASWNSQPRLFCCTECFVEHLGAPRQLAELPYDLTWAPTGPQPRWLPTMIRRHACWEEPDERDPLWLEVM